MKELPISLIARLQIHTDPGTPSRARGASRSQKRKDFSWKCSEYTSLPVLLILV